MHPLHPKPGTIIRGAALEILKTWPDRCLDLVIADPPYGLGLADWDMEPDYGPWVREVSRLLKVGGTAYVFGFPEIMANHWSAFPARKRWLTWAVSNRVTPGCKTWQPTQEAIVMFWKGKAPHFDRDSVREAYTPGYQRLRGSPRPKTAGRFGSRPTTYGASSGALPRSVIHGPGLSGGTGAKEGVGHPTQKPTWLMERLIRASCPAAGLVLDLFSGTGTTALAAHRLGRSWVAIEQDPRWCQAALERLRAEGGAAEIYEPLGVNAVEFDAWKAGIERELAALKAMIESLRGSPEPI